MYFTSSWVERGAVCLEGSGHACKKPTPVPLAKCRSCKMRTRVLPNELFPYKIYSLPIIARHGGTYPTSSLGLRTDAKRTSGHAPHYTTIHRWTAGLGERLLDRVKHVSRADAKPATANQRTLVPTASLLAETSRQRGAQIQQLWERSFHIPEFKYHSERRREQLEACVRFFRAATAIFPEESEPFTAWLACLTDVFHVPAWDFPSSVQCMRIQRPVSPDPPLRSENEQPRPVRREPLGPRSPPHRVLAL